MSGENILPKIKRTERVIRRFFAVFIAYVILYSLSNYIIPEFNEIAFKGLLIYPIVYGVSSVLLIDMFLKKNISFYEFVFEVEIDHIDLLTKVINNIGIILFYLCLQVSIMIYFSPNFESIYFANAPLWLPLFFSTSLAISQVYRKIYKEEFSFRAERIKPFTE